MGLNRKADSRKVDNVVYDKNIFDVLRWVVKKFDQYGLRSTGYDWSVVVKQFNN